MCFLQLLELLIILYMLGVKKHESDIIFFLQNINPKFMVALLELCSDFADNKWNLKILHIVVHQLYLSKIFEIARN